MKSKDAVGVIGLGIMGGAFARNLAAGGYRVIGYDIDAAQRRAIGKAGVEIASSAEHVVREAPTIITSLPHPKALDETAEMIANADADRRVIIEASTFTLADKERVEKQLRRAGHLMLDCPVSGTGSQARGKDLVIYASGDSKTIAALEPLFLAFSRKVHDLGAFGNGSRMKYVANLLVAINNVASAEAMVLGMKAGLDPQVIFEMVTSGAGNSRVFELRAPMMVENRYDEPTMKIKIWQKDMAVIGEYAAMLGVPTPLFSATLPIYAAALNNHAMEDTAAVCAVMEAMADVKRKSRGKRRRSS